MLKIDLNCDMGESFGAWTMGADEALMKVVSSVNIACGFHAGDPGVIRRTVELALENNVAVGAHPSFLDLQGFGRREMRLSPQEIFDVVLYQTGALAAITKALGGQLHHVKPHGALYNLAAKNNEIAAPIARAVKAIDRNLILYGLSGSALIDEAEKIDLKTASEVFADRTYQPDGSLTPRAKPGALIQSVESSVRQALEMVFEQQVTAIGGEKVPLRAETVCIHGDGADALGFATAIRENLTEKNISIGAI